MHLLIIDYLWNKNKDKFQGKKIGLIFSGGNVDCDDLPWID